MTYFVLTSLFIFLIVSINKDYIILLLVNNMGIGKGKNNPHYINVSFIFRNILYFSFMGIN